LFSYVGSSGAMMIGIGSQLISFAFLARYLGADQFGLLMTLTAATALALNVCGLGAGEAFMRRIALEKELYPTLLGHALLLTLSTGIVLTLIVMICFVVFSPGMVAGFGGLLPLGLFVFANVAIYRWIVICENIFLGYKMFSNANLIVLVFGILRAGATILATLVFDVHQLADWVWWHVAIHIIGLIGCLYLLKNFPAPKLKIITEELPLGIHFCVTYFFSTLTQNADRLVLSTFTSPAIVGSYALASRFFYTSVLTSNAYMRLRYPALAAASGENPQALVKLCLSYLAPVLGIAFLTSAGLFIAAPFLPMIFGAGYQSAVPHLQIGCWLIIPIALTSIPYDALGASARHVLRAWIVNIGGVISVAVLIVLTYAYGITGMFVALFATHAALAASLWLALFKLRRER